MTEKQDIEPEDKYGHAHGYQEWYYIGYTIMHRCNYKHGREIGYEEWHTEYHDDDSQSKTRFYIR